MFIKKIISLVNKMVRKRNIILFNSFPAYSDNSLALYEYIVNNRPDIVKTYRLIWGQNKDELRLKRAKDLKLTVVNKKSIKGLLVYLCSKYVISTHSYFNDVKSGRNQLQINLWHGCGYKSMTDTDDCYRGDVMIVTSELYKNIHSKIFKIPKEKVIVTGLPRNDKLFQKKDVLRCFDVQKNLFEKIMIWLPTYRKAKIGHVGIDGSLSSFGISNISFEEYKLLNEILKEKGILLIIKPHPMDSVNMNYQMTNLKFIRSETLQQYGVDLYELLPNTDILLSDYSSVVVDYLNLDKPIAMVLSDMNEYQESRGFIFRNVEDYMPGPILKNLNELIEYIKSCDEINEKWKNKRVRINNLLNNYSDGQNSQRVSDYIWGPLIDTTH